MFFLSVVILFLLKLYKGSFNVLERVTRDFGRDGLKLFRELEKFSIKIVKLELDIDFLICAVFRIAYCACKLN